MPNCFQLTKKGTASPSALSQVDEELCAVVGEPVHATRWLYSWYDIIGLLIALGNQIGTPELRQKTLEIYDVERHEKINKILDYLETNYVSDAWYARRGVSE